MQALHNASAKQGWIQDNILFNCFYLSHIVHIQPVGEHVSPVFILQNAWKTKSECRVAMTMDMMVLVHLKFTYLIEIVH